MLTNNGLLQTLGLLALVSTLSGCAMESADGQLGDEEAKEQTAEALGVWGTASWGSGNGPNPLDLGSDSNRTCFLTGIRGQLYADDDTPDAKVGVYQQNGHWWLEAKRGAGSSTGVVGDAVCISNTSNRTTFGNMYGSGLAYNYVPRSRARQCFLSHFQVTSGFAWQGSNTTMPGARLEKSTLFENGTATPIWKLTSYFTPEQEGLGGSVSAVCVDIGKTAEIFFSWDNPTPLNVMSTINTACGLTRLSGNFYDHGPNSGNGARVYQGSNGMWQVTAGYTKGVEGSCIQ